MRLSLACLFFLGVVAGTYAEPQFGFGYPMQENVFRAGIPFSSIEQAQPDARSFFTLTVTMSTTSTTVISTSYVTCTTTTAAISYCTASGRRRRGVPIPKNKEGRGLFYNEEEVEGDDGNIFLPSPDKLTEDTEAEVVRAERQSPLPTVPFVVQPGFSAPAGNPRFLLAFSTSTTTITSTTVLTSSLTAICSSTTGFITCGTSGK